MRIRYLLASGLAAVVLIGGINLWALTVNLSSFAKNDETQNTINVIARETTNLLVLSQEYLLHNNHRATLQWRSAHSNLLKLVGQFNEDSGDSERFKSLDEELRSNLQALPPLLDALEAVKAEPPTLYTERRANILADHWLAQTRRVGDSAFDLSQLVANKRVTLRKSRDRLQMTTQLVLMVLFVALAWLCWRRILVPMGHLRAAAKAIESGNLFVQTEYKAKDEFGDLGRSFNAMSQALQARESAVNQHLEQLARSEDTQLRVGRMANVGSWDFNPETHVVQWSVQTQSLLEITNAPEMHFDDALAFFTEPSRTILLPAMDAAMEQGTPWDLELALTTAHGNHRWVRLQGQVERNGSAAVRLVGAIQDITERHNDQEQLRHAMAHAKEANSAKSAFLANISHEIRTPMNAVISLTYLLEQTPINEEQRQLLRKAKAASNSLLGLINDVLDLAKIEAGELTLEKNPMDLPDTLQDVISMMAGNAVTRNVALSLDIPADIPHWIMGDALRLRQVVMNLVSNAIKFSENGTVKVLVSQEKHHIPEHTVLHIAVQDSGIGIAPEAISRLFQPFTQADDSTTRRFGGTGLGLSIVKKLCGAMDGKIGLTSTLGKGSCFTVSIPFAITTEPQDTAHRQATLRVLIADDDLLSCQALEKTTQALGWNATIVHSGAEVLEQVKHSLTQQQPLDAIILDWDMPELNGLETLAQLHDQWKQDELPNVVMVTAHERSRLMAQPHANLPNAVLTKPATASSLFNAVHTALVHRHGNAERMLASSTVESAGVQRLAGARLLVVDDSPINQEVARKILEREGAIITLADNGAQALDILRAQPQGFDTVLMDIQMPIMGGLEATGFIRNELDLIDLPVIALTAGAMAAERHRAIEQGMTDFISKPFDPPTLVLMIRRYAEQVRGAPLALVLRETDSALIPSTDQHKPTANSGNINAAEVTATTWPQIPDICLPEAQQILSGDLPLFAKLLQRMLDSYTPLEPLLPSAMVPTSPIATAASRKELAAYIHKMRGAAGMLGAKSLHTLAGTCENALRASPWDADTYTQAAPELIAAWDSLYQHASAWLVEYQACTQTLDTVHETSPPEASALPATSTHPIQQQTGMAADSNHLQYQDASARSIVPAPSDAPASHSQIQAFITALQEQDLCAADQLTTLAPTLRTLLTADQFKALQTYIDQLDFAQAAQLLESTLGSSA